MTIKDLYLFIEFGTLPSGVAAQCASVVGSIEPLARAIRGLLRPCGATRRVSPVSARSAERQSSQIDESDAGAGQLAGQLRSLPAFHHRRAMDGRARLAAPQGD